MKIHDTRSWEREAACAGTDPRLWFGEDDVRESGSDAHRRRENAKAICRTCPVLTDCLVDELMRPHTEQHGIRGATTPGERVRILARWRAAGLVPRHDPPTDADVLRTLLGEEPRQRTA
ncbi:WhiB family transcriptional regulator [Saccharopolyspora gregorii]|uniref:4Fe-4S Wbl-type domain-containing protein n=1 Tax=Saccharopolyspora gregorii TaxID=33914 RepID=A0ABP6RPA0_9PSEU